MGVKPISERGRHIVLAMARRRTPVMVAELQRELPNLGLLDRDVSELIHGGTLAARGTMTEAELKAELEAVWPHLIQAQRTGQEFRWKTRNTFAVELTKVGRDMVPLLLKMRV